MLSVLPIVRDALDSSLCRLYPRRVRFPPDSVHFPHAQTLSRHLHCFFSTLPTSFFPPSSESSLPLPNAFARISLQMALIGKESLPAGPAIDLDGSDTSPAQVMAG